MEKPNGTPLEYRNWGVFKATEYCNEEWYEDGLRHVCYLNEGHDGKHICGMCDHNLHELEEIRSQTPIN